MVWIFNNNQDMELWYHAFLKRHPDVMESGTLTTWELVNRFAKKSLIKGYLLYSQDTSSGQTASHRSGMNRSL